MITAKDFKVGDEVYSEGLKKGVAIMILRGYGSFCCYLGVPRGTKIEEFIKQTQWVDSRINVHGGFTFFGLFEERPWAKDYYWVGWDYAHAGDALDTALSNIFNFGGSQTKDWTLVEVKKEAFQARGKLQKLIVKYG